MTWLHFKSMGRLNFFVFCICFLFVCAGKQRHIIPGVLYEDSPIVKDFKAKGIQILSIPYLFGHVDIDFFTENLDNIFDQRRTINCLKNKRILVLGDSVLEEFHIDISILLSGIGSNEKIANNFIYFAGSKTPRGTFYRLPNKVLLYNHPNRRNITIISEESQTYLRHRFMGHYDIKSNYYGVRSFIEPSFVRDELVCLLGLRGDDIKCPLPDIIILNSGHHDVYQSSKTFETSLRAFLSQLIRLYRKFKFFHVEIIWKGTLISGSHENNHEKLVELDLLARKIVEEYYITYVNTTSVLSYVPRYVEKLENGDRPYQLYTSDRVHHGGISISAGFTKIGTVSMLVAQRILYAICPGGSELNRFKYRSNISLENR